MTTEAERAARAQSGSKRKRDREAADRQSYKAVPTDVEPSDRSGAAWQAALTELRTGIPGRVAEMWLDPIVVAGERGDALCLVCPWWVRSWLERRFAQRLGDAVRDASDFQGVLLYDLAPRGARLRDGGQG